MTRDVDLVVELQPSDAARLVDMFGAEFKCDAGRIRDAIARKSIFNLIHTAAVVKVDINRPDMKKIDWQSPVAQQFKLQGIPHFKVYGPDGKLIAEDVPGVSRGAREMVDKWCEALK